MESIPDCSNISPAYYKDDTNFIEKIGYTIMFLYSAYLLVRNMPVLNFVIKIRKFITLNKLLIANILTLLLLLRKYMHSQNC